MFFKLRAFRSDGLHQYDEARMQSMNAGVDAGKQVGVNVDVNAGYEILGCTPALCK